MGIRGRRSVRTLVAISFRRSGKGSSDECRVVGGGGGGGSRKLAAAAAGARPPAGTSSSERCMDIERLQAPKRS